MRANTKKRANTMKDLIAKADSLHSYYVRQLAAAKFHNQNPEAPFGYAPCYICGTPHHWREGRKTNLMHYVSRKVIHYIVRWDFMNTKSGCVFCNKHLLGNLIKFRTKLVLEYGEAAIATMELMSRNRIKDLRFLLEHIINERLMQLLELKEIYPEVELPKGFVKIIKELK